MVFFNKRVKPTNDLNFIWKEKALPSLLNMILFLKFMVLVDLCGFLVLILDWELVQDSQLYKYFK